MVAGLFKQPRAARGENELVSAPTDIPGVIDQLVRTGAAVFPLSAIPGDFVEWRRRVRQAARARELRVSITRSAEMFVLVDNLDYEVPDDHRHALADVIGARLTGQELRYDDALYARRRARLRIVRNVTPNVDE